MLSGRLVSRVRRQGLHGIPALACPCEKVANSIHPGAVHRPQPSCLLFGLVAAGELSPSARPASHGPSGDWTKYRQAQLQRAASSSWPSPASASCAHAPSTRPRCHPPWVTGIPLGFYVIHMLSNVGEKLGWLKNFTMLLAL
ncbi:MAG: hypothetical protein MZU97_27235 [Bacillus subtilis]|nr:hypothetical protein [Bacillus subtilis]